MGPPCVCPRRIINYGGDITIWLGKGNRERSSLFSSAFADALACHAGSPLPANRASSNSEASSTPMVPDDGTSTLSRVGSRRSHWISIVTGEGVSKIAFDWYPENFSPTFIAGRSTGDLSPFLERRRFNHSRWQPIADRNERPNRTQ